MVLLSIFIFLDISTLRVDMSRNMKKNCLTAFLNAPGTRKVYQTKDESNEILIVLILHFSLLFLRFKFWGLVVIKSHDSLVTICNIYELETKSL